MEADGKANTKTRERTEGTDTTVQAVHGDSCTTQKVQDGWKTSFSFGVKAEPPDLPCREDVLVEDGAAAPMSRLPFLEMHTTTAASGLVPTGKTSTATETTFNEPLLQFHSTEEANGKNSPTPYASYDSKVFQNSNLAAAPYSRRVVETKYRQNMTFDPCGAQGPLHACPFLGLWRALVCGEVCMLEQLVTSFSVFPEEIRWLYEAKPALCLARKVSLSRAARGYTNRRDEQGSCRRWRLEVIRS